jgi:dTDP-glucose 4,6-dehydratase
MTKIHAIKTHVLITGAAGFIGSSVMNYLDKTENYYFHNVDKLDYNLNLKNVEAKNHTFYKTDISDVSKIKNILTKNNVKIVFHFATRTHVDESFEDSILYTKNNILGTYYLLECCREYGKLDKFIHVSTDEIYGEIFTGQSTEKTLLNPTNPHAATKAGAEFLVKSNDHSFKLPIIIVRMNNVYGPRQYPDKLIPRFICYLFENKKCTIQGKQNIIRNFIYIDDVSCALEVITRKGVIGQVYNIGTKNEYSVMDITRLLIDKIIINDLLVNTVDYDDYIKYIKDRQFNDHRYAMDSTNLTNLGWEEHTPFDVGIDETINWYKNNLNYWAPESCFAGKRRLAQVDEIVWAPESCFAGKCRLAQVDEIVWAPESCFAGKCRLAQVDETISKVSRNDFNVTHISKNDYNNQYLELLKQLTEIDPKQISQNDFDQFVDNLNADHRIYVIKNNNNEVIACATLYIEHKLIHNISKVAHIEDVVVNGEYRGNGLGKKIIDYVMKEADEYGCYKTILNCSDKNKGFYEKCGFVVKGVEMGWYKTH